MSSANKTTLVKARRPLETQTPDAPDACVLRRFRLVFNAVKTHLREVEKKAGIAGAQVWALSVIQERPGISVTDVARAMGVHQSTASNPVKTLITKQLVSAEKGDVLARLDKDLGELITALGADARGAGIPLGQP